MLLACGHLPANLGKLPQGARYQSRSKEFDCGRFAALNFVRDHPLNTFVGMCTESQIR